MKSQLNVIVGNQTREALNKIVAAWGTTQSEVVSILIMHHYLKHYEEGIKDVMRTAYIQIRKEEASAPTEFPSLPSGVGRPADFVEDRCKVESHAASKAADTFQSYKTWCQVVKRKPVSNRTFKHEMEKLGFYSTRRGDGNYFLNIELRY